MKPAVPLRWPLLVGGLSLAITAGLWQHEQATQDRNLRSHFDFGLRQTATRVEERLTSYEQMLRGVRGLFDASDEVTRVDFADYVDDLTAGGGFAGLRTIGHAPLVPAKNLPRLRAEMQAAGLAVDASVHTGTDPQVAPVLFAAPNVGPIVRALGADLYADPVLRVAMDQARDSGGMAITQRLRIAGRAGDAAASGFLMFMPLYAKRQPHDTVADRRAHLTGWVLASFQVGDLMASLYGEGTPGLDVRVHDGVQADRASLMYPLVADAEAPPLARFAAKEYIGFAGHAWTLMVRSTPEFDAQFSNDAAQVIAIAGSGLSLVLALLTWQLLTGRERAHAQARAMTRQLRDSSERYRRIVETADEGIWMVDAGGRTSFVNPKLQQMLGRTESELMGRRWTAFMDEASQAAIAGADHAPAAAGPTVHAGLRLLRKDGTVLWARLSTSPILDETGQPAGSLAMVTDVSEQRQAEINRAALEDQLRQAQKMEAIGTLAGGIAHDFNNILAAILGNVALAGQALEARHSAAAALDQIRQAGERGRSLVQQIVAFSRQQPQRRVRQPLQPLLEETARLLRSTLPAGVELELRLDPTTPEVSADATQLQQVLMNLCTNAWHAMPDGAGRIVIGLEATLLDPATSERLSPLSPGRHAHVWVSDNGCGIDESTQQRIFEPFFTTKAVGKGTGLGLAVVHGIVRSHGGAITVHSVPGQGTCFDLYFPLAADQAAPAVAPPAAGAAAPAGQGQHVLYTDDDPVMVMLVEAVLQRAGYRVTSLTDPHQALARAQATDDPVDMVVTDFNMPELSGLDIASALQRSRPGLPVVITTGYVSEHLRQQAQAAGVRQVLQKEFTIEQLAEVLHQVLGEPAAASVATSGPTA